MNTARQKLSARDYKHAGRRENLFSLAQYKQFGLGLAVGLAVALGVWLHGQSAQSTALEAALPASVAEAGDAEQAPAGGEAGPAAEDYDFYDMLPNFEVVVPEKESDPRRNLPGEPVAQPGAYVLQVGSYRNLPDAQRMVDKLDKQGIDAAIQKVQVDADVWHRVRIGPLRDLARLNATREALRAADIDAILYRVGD